MSPQEIVGRVATFIWAAFGFIAGFGQAVVWIVLVGFFTVTVLLSFNAARRPPKRLAARARPERGRPRAAQWRGWLSQIGPGASGRSMLSHELRRLALAVLAHSEGGQAADLEERIRSGRLEADESIRWLLDHRWEKPRAGLTRRGRPGRDAGIDIPRVTRIVDALERRLGADGGPERKDREHAD